LVPVDQTVFGYPDGNCMAAAVASVLELRLEVVPNMASPHWLAILTGFLEPFGICPLSSASPPPGYSVMCGDGPRGHMHAVVALGDTIVHDPHPDRTGLLTAHHYLSFVPCARWPRC